MPPCYGGETIIAVSLSRFKRRHIRRDVAASASSVPNIRYETAKRAGLRSNADMRPNAIYVSTVILVVSRSAIPHDCHVTEYKFRIYPRCYPFESFPASIDGSQLETFAYLVSNLAEPPPRRIFAKTEFKEIVAILPGWLISLYAARIAVETSDIPPRRVCSSKKAVKITSCALELVLRVLDSDCNLVEIRTLSCQEKGINAGMEVKASIIITGAARSIIRALLRSRTTISYVPFQIATILLIIGLSQAKTSGRDLSKASGQLDETILESADDSKTEGKEEDRLPILPPIILLDFANDTDENVGSEEKSKRTVNNGLGYGLDKNALQPRRYNYYFPAGKSGTAVTIEESISPFLPQTIIEKVQPVNQREQFFHGTRQNLVSSQFQGQTNPNLRYTNFQQSSKAQPAYGSRTKPQKPPTSHGSYQNFLATPKPSVSSFGIQYSGYRSNVPTTVQSPLAFSSTETVRYVTPSPGNFASQHSATFDYASPSPFPADTQPFGAQSQNLRSNINPHGFETLPQSVETSTVPTLSYDPRLRSTAQASTTDSRYTLDNGVRYENKIFWKYPDGRVSDVPPATYVEYPQSSAQRAKSQGPHSIYEASTTENSILSQGPVQFPTVPEQTVQQANPFVSSESLSSSLPQQQVYRLGYQNLVTQRQNANLARQRTPTSGSPASTYPFSSTYTGTKTSTSNQKLNYETPYLQTVSRYESNSPNPEYTDSYVTEATVNDTSATSFFDSSGENSRVTDYTSKVQNYLDASLTSDETKKQTDLNGYTNLRYSDLLNYNPSISDYIRDPSSILNVRPTFVQAGNSLIPVIILRVDGASPIRTKTAQNINLKALLQQYLIQYANSIQELARPSSYDLGTESIAKNQSPLPGKSPVLDLIRLTQEDARGGPTYAAGSFSGRSSYEADLNVPADFDGGHYGERSTIRQKTKNVEILDDPRFAAYKTKS
ncbi:uncharacterized protein LOC143149695 [Ptiloglossa arizonensis]|uniref:uncharacterized protein LOC143149695 n=1 Tax=Ptiloglossa arizonensis TaxID=3350558 RepID=UPI003F9F54BA